MLIFDVDGKLDQNQSKVYFSEIRFLRIIEGRLVLLPNFVFPLENEASFEDLSIIQHLNDMRVVLHQLWEQILELQLESIFEAYLTKFKLHSLEIQYHFLLLVLFMLLLTHFYSHYKYIPILKVAREIQNNKIT